MSLYCPKCGEKFLFEMKDKTICEECRMAEINTATANIKSTGIMVGYSISLNLDQTEIIHPDEAANLLDNNGLPDRDKIEEWIRDGFTSVNDIFDLHDMELEINDIRPAEPDDVD